jgi:hypothetical protein
MLQLTLFPDNPPGSRGIAPPWTTASQRWLKLDRKLPPEEFARQTTSGTDSRYSSGSAYFT